jgi:2-C-methyl-D-erythritol 4-phosphate cytidylyltransferase
LTIGVVLAASGVGTRLGARRPKAFLELAGETLLARSMAAFLAHPEIGPVVAAVPDPALAAGLLPPLGDRVRLVRGGPERQDSVRLAIAELGEVDLILVHDAARPLVSRAVIDAVIAAAREHGAAVPAIPIPDTVKRVDGQGRLLETVPRDGLVLAQTPQGFRADLLRRAHAEAERQGAAGTDDAALVERLGHHVVVVPGDPRNIKITAPGDLELARLLLGAGDSSRGGGGGPEETHG